MAARAKTQGTLLAEEINRDPDFRKEWRILHSRASSQRA